MLQKYNKTWDKISNIIKKRFDSEPVYSQVHLIIKIKFYEGKINTTFHDVKIPKEDSSVSVFQQY